MTKIYNLTKGIFLLLSLMAFSYSAQAQTRTWAGGATGDWSDNANWSGGDAPGSNETALFNAADVTVTLTANTTVKILDIRANVTIDIGSNTLDVVANSNPVRPDGHTLEIIGSGTVNITPGSATGDAVQFRGDGGKFNVGAGVTVNVASGDQGFTSKSDASNGEINNDGVINFDMVTSGKAIELNSSHPLTLVNGKCAVIELGGNRILTSLTASSTITSNGLITNNPASGAGGGILLRIGSSATNNGFYDYSNSANFATGNGGIGTYVENGVELNPAVSIDAGATCMIDLTSTSSGMEAYDWAFGGTIIAANTADGSLDLTGANFPNAAGPHTITVDGCPEYSISIEVTNTCAAAVLPVELINFTGSERETVNILEWKTASEINNDFFEVQRSTNGIDFETLEIIRGNGTVYTVSSYSFIDEKPVPVGYYRLRQVDFDGEYELSNIVTVKRNLLKDDAKLFPSPVNDVLSINYQATADKKVTMSLVDMTGRVLISKLVDAVEGNNEFNLDLMNLPSGAYITRLSSRTYNISQKIIKL